jgi:hypothetical protein
MEKGEKMADESRFEPFYRAASDQVLGRIEAKLAPRDRLHEFIEYWIKRIKEYENPEMRGVEPDERKKIAEGCLRYVAGVLSHYRVKEAERLYSVATAILEGKALPKEEPSQASEVSKPAGAANDASAAESGSAS